MSSVLHCSSMGVALRPTLRTPTRSPPGCPASSPLFTAHTSAHILSCFLAPAPPLLRCALLQGFLVEGLQRTSAGLGSVIIDSQPLTVALLASLLFGERLGPAGWLGMLMGVAGLCLLEVPPSALANLTVGLSGAGAAVTPPAALHSAAVGMAATGREWLLWDSGEWWMLLAAQSMAVGTVMVGAVALQWVCPCLSPSTGCNTCLSSIHIRMHVRHRHACLAAFI
jgi:drug/metabolite transporter (DMT)-like permease